MLWCPTSQQTVATLYGILRRKLHVRGGMWTAYRIKKAKPTERTPATEREVDSHSGWSTTAGQSYREDSSYRRKTQLAQWMVSYIEWARPTAWTPATEDEVQSRSGRFTTSSGREVWFTTSSGRDLQRGLQLQRATWTRRMDGPISFDIPLIYLQWS